MPVNWKIIDGPTQREPEPTFALFAWTVARGDEQRTIIVAIAKTLMAVEGALDFARAQSIATRGQPEVAYAIEHDRAPARITITRDGIFEAPE